jgi:acyl transferase domain-containing protein
MMKPILAEFAELVAAAAPQPPQSPFLSNLSGKLIESEQAVDPQYWVAHLSSTVEFAKNMDYTLNGEEKIYLEVGPGTTLSQLMRRHDSSATDRVFSSLRREKDQTADETFLLNTLGKLWLAGIEIDWRSFYGGQAAKRVALPTYAYQKERYWVDPASGVPNQFESDYDSRQSPIKRVDDWFYEPVWQLEPLRVNTLKNSDLKPQPMIGDNQRCVVFVDHNTLVKPICEQLAVRGFEVIEVCQAEQYQKFDERAYGINPNDMADYQSLFTALNADAKQLSLIVHAWHVSDDPVDNSRCDPQQAQALLLGLLYLCQALDSQPSSDDIELKVVATNSQYVEPLDIVDPTRGTISAMCKVISAEYANLDCQTIDIRLDVENTNKLAGVNDRLVHELCAKKTHQTISLRNNQRWYQCFEPMTLEAANGSSSMLKNDGVYLISGGLGGIGLSLAEQLSQQVKAKIVLLSRSAFPEQAQWHSTLEQYGDDHSISKKINQIKAIQSRGSQVLVCQTDICDADSVNTMVSRVKAHFGGVNGLIHSAGVAGGGLMSLKTDDMLAAVIAPKITGTIVLDQALANENIDFFINCSSLASVLGGIGQFDYCAANAFQDAFSFAHVNRDTRYITINWDAWAEVGMAVNTAVSENLNEAKQANLRNAITSEEGKAVFKRIIDSGCSQVLVSTETVAYRFDEVRQSSLLFAAHADSKTIASGFQRPQLLIEYVAPKQPFEQQLVQLWEDLLGIAGIGVNDNFFELGGDSLLLNTLVSRVNTQWAVSFGIKLAFASPTIAQMAGFLNNHFNVSSQSDVDDVEYEEEVL